MIFQLFESLTQIEPPSRVIGLVLCFFAQYHQVAIQVKEIVLYWDETYQVIYEDGTTVRGQVQ
ncbi:MAG: hypothetical protein HYV60_06840 [Planctomycetia bacterium]|nr:hypothetical protein [Planctomycetia bacterium]